MNMKMNKNFLALLFAGAALAFASCAPTPADVAGKIFEKKELSQKDYKVAVDYTREVLENISDTISKYENDRQGLVAAFTAMMPEYRDGDIILAKLQQTDPSVLDAETRKTYEKLMALQEENARRFANAMGYGATLSAPSAGTDSVESSSASESVDDAVEGSAL